MEFKIGQEKIHYQLLIMFLLMAIGLHEPPPLYAQPGVDLGWSQPLDLAAGMQGYGTFPSITADQMGGVHVFWNQVEQNELGQRSTVFYMYWNGDSWTKPVDVFAGSGGIASAMDARAVVDGDGIMHTVWIQENRLNYAQHHVLSPISARSWSAPIPLAIASRGSVGPVEIAQGADGVLHVVYLQDTVGQSGIYYVQSTDNGNSWSQPSLLSLAGTEWTSARVRYVFDLLVQDEALNVTWHQENVGLFFVRSNTNGQTWTEPLRVEEDTGKWPALAAPQDGQLLLLDVGNIGEENCWKRQFTSSDGGQTWSGPTKILFPARGCLGRMSVLKDSTGGLHVVMSAYEDISAIVEKIWYGTWNEETWNIPQLAFGTDAEYARLGTQPDFPSATISAGNLLHVVFHTDEGNIWYMQRPLAVSQTNLITFPTPTSVHPTITVEPTPVSESTPATPPPSVDKEPPAADVPVFILSGISSFLVVVVTLLYVKSHRH